MAKLSKKAATIKGILACGLTETFRSNKYRTFNRVSQETGDVIFVLLVGESGALRVLRPREQGDNLAHSQSITGTKRHGAYEYVGRICDSCELTAKQFTQVGIDFANGEIK